MNRSSLCWIVLLTLGAGLLTHCGGGGGGSDGDGGGELSSSSLTERSFSASSGSDGIVTISFSVASDVQSAQLVTTADGANLQLTSLTIDGTPIGASELLGDGEGTFAQTSPLASIGLPARTGEYEARFLVTKNRRALAQQRCQATLIERKGASGGHTLPVNLILVGPVNDSEESLRGTHNAIDIADSLLGGAGLTLDVIEYNVDGPRILPDPREGSSFYLETGRAVRPYAVNVYVGVDLDGTSSPSYRYGSVPHSPGPANTTAFSAVALSILDLTGGDGIFNSDRIGSVQEHDDEIRLFGEELGRLISQYAGLSDIVFFQGGSVERADTIADTPSCLTTAECRNSEEARANLMFPFPLRRFEGESDTFFRRGTLTSGQKNLLGRSVIAR